MLAGTQPQLLSFPRAARRRIPPEKGRALEVLGHAVEYLSDEYAVSLSEAGRLDSGDPQIEAIQILMSANRQVYYSCPDEEPLLRRLARRLTGRGDRALERAGRTAS